MEINKVNKINDEVYTFTLKSKLKVALIKKKDYKKYLCTLSCNFGGLDTAYLEDGKIKNLPIGLAHFLEHKNFAMEDGTDVSYKLSSLGTDSNAFTSNNQTAYYIDGFKNYEESLSILFDYVFKPYFTRKNVSKEKGIIIQEYKSYIDLPSEKLHKMLMNSMFNKTFTKDILGDIKTIKSMNEEVLYEAYEAFYDPSNIILTIIGDIDIDKTVALILKKEEELKLESKKEVKHVYALEAKKVTKMKVKELDIPNDMVLIGIRLDKNGYEHNENALFHIKMSILLEKLIGKYSAEYQEMLDKGLINSFEYGVSTNENTGYIEISADTSKSKEYIRYMRRLLNKVGILDISEEEFEIFKKAIIGAKILELNDLFNSMYTYIDYHNRKCDPYEVLDEALKIKREDILDLKKYFKKENIAFVLGKGPSK